ncbi:MAG: putative superfamily hydrolase [Herbinix sp.]|jgi:uncharacterized protein|nr:putative superfamily hydrolase [Herbinix sp.]
MNSSPSVIKLELAQEFIDTIKELLKHKQLQDMHQYVQHGDTSTFEHCLMVAYCSYRLAKALPSHFDYKSIVRGAMLHDFYLYDWHIPHYSHRLHGFSHARCALDNASKLLPLNKTEADIIEHHMWPLTLRKYPRSKEAFLVCMVDKYCSLAETFHSQRYKKELEHLYIVCID